MARYTGAKLRITRRLGDLPGLTSKKGKRTQRPGQHGATQKKLTQYAIRLEEKQKLRFNYGLGEKQLRRLVQESFRSREHSGHKLLELLERRLDSVLFRAGFAPTIPAARQLVSHKHVLVDGKLVNIPSYRIKKGQTITVKEKTLKLPLVISTLEQPSLARPAWISFENNTAKIIALPDRDSLGLPIEESLIVELYSRMVS